MALSNIFREPRREIIEQAAGAALFVVWIGTAHWLVRLLGATSTVDLVGGTVVMSMALVLLIPLVFMIHAAGEFVCGALARMGVDPRPRQRY